MKRFLNLLMFGFYFFFQICLFKEVGAMVQLVEPTPLFLFYFYFFVKLMLFHSLLLLNCWYIFVFR